MEFSNDCFLMFFCNSLLQELFQRLFLHGMCQAPESKNNILWFGFETAIKKSLIVAGSGLNE